MNFGEEELLNEIRGGIKNGCKKIMKTQRLMTIKKISKMLFVAFYVGTGLKTPIKLGNKLVNTKKLEIRGRAPQATLLKNIRRFATIATLQIGIENVIVAFVLHILVITIQKIPVFFSQ